jgi:hypothetical protein
MHLETCGPTGGILGKFSLCYRMPVLIILVDGVFYAELNEFFQRELAEEGYSGVEVRVTPTVTDISEPPPPLEHSIIANPH